MYKRQWTQVPDYATIATRQHSHSPQQPLPNRKRILSNYVQISTTVACAVNDVVVVIMVAIPYHYRYGDASAADNMTKRAQISRSILPVVHNAGNIPEPLCTELTPKRKRIPSDPPSLLPKRLKLYDLHLKLLSPDRACRPCNHAHTGLRLGCRLGPWLGKIAEDVTILPGNCHPTPTAVSALALD
jgi:hypothetical protein